MKKLILLSMLMCSYILCNAQATSITVDNQTPGWLSSKINYGDQLTLQSLKVSGFLNVDDLKFIGTLIQTHNLKKELNLHDCQIINSKGAIENIFAKNPFKLTKACNIDKLVFPIKLESAETSLIYLYVDTLVIGGESMPIIKENMLITCPSTKIKNLIIREGVDSIASGTFCHKTNEENILESIELPSSLNGIGESAFRGCDKLKSINLPDSIRFIGAHAFLATAYTPDTVYVPKNVITWRHCINPKSNQVYYFHENIKKIENYGYDGTTRSNCFSQNNNSKLHIKSHTPPSFSNSGGSEKCLSGNTVYVPYGSANLYLNASYWKYATIIEEYTNLYFTSDISCIVGEEYDLNSNITISTNVDGVTKNDIIWSVSDKSIAHISKNQNGEVVLVGEKAGQTYLFAELQGYTSSKTSCLVVINNQPVTEVKLNVSDLVIHDIGTQSQLVATVLPENATNKKVTWKSSNESVCYVSSNGMLVATGYGTAIIIVTTDDGGYVAYCNVKVEPSAIAVSEISISPEAISINQGETYQLVLNILPENATNKTIIWKSSDVNIATVDKNGLVSAINSGNATISATTTDGSNLTAECQITSVSGIDDIKINELHIEIARYNQYGQILKEPIKGINIVRYNDGSTRKEWVK